MRCIVASVSGLMRNLEALLFNTRETVETETPARTAMSFRVVAIAFSLR
jgi:hypothetical protein